jgi:hypothetical protein
LAIFRSKLVMMSALTYGNSITTSNNGKNQTSLFLRDLIQTVITSKRQVERNVSLVATCLSLPAREVASVKLLRKLHQE